MKRERRNEEGCGRRGKRNVQTYLNLSFEAYQKVRLVCLRKGGVEDGRREGREGDEKRGMEEVEGKEGRGRGKEFRR
jgi:hypothetical protein